MRLLFIENRHKTYFYDPIAKKLQNEGHEVHWLVQNKEFLPSSGFNIYTINYPSKRFKIINRDPNVEKVIESDRQVNHFDKQDISYFYYYNKKIETYLLELKPDIVFGESTAFHELLTIENSKKLGILYLNPSTCRYPVGRFSFYQYDTLTPYKGSGEELSYQEANTIVSEIMDRTSKPDYMIIKKSNKSKTRRDKIKKIISYYKGEKYNTPNPIIKFKIEKQKESLIGKWDAIATANTQLPSSGIKVLYPLQMQPEANIDVWGRKYRNQANLIENLAKNLPEDTFLYVKPNPKSKYELSNELLQIVSSYENIVPLPHSSKMDGVLPQMDLVITVTGTIAIECVLSNKPVVTLVKTINNESPNCIYLDTLDNRKLKEIIDLIRCGDFVKITDNQKVDFIKMLNKTSYKGIISDPFTNENCISEANIKCMFNAFSKLVTNQEN